MSRLELLFAGLVYITAAIALTPLLGPEAAVFVAVFAAGVTL